MIPGHNHLAENVDDETNLDHTVCQMLPVRRSKELWEHRVGASILALDGIGCQVGF